MKSTRFSFGSAATFLGALLVVVSLSFSLASCKTDNDDDDPILLVGKWQDSSNFIYEISKNEFSNYGEGFDSYAGNNLVISITSNDFSSGYIYIQYTRAADENWNYTTDKTKAPDVGKWYAISFKELTNSSIKVSGAYGEKTSTETLEEAITEFTIENGYFANYSDCTKLSN